LSEKALVNEEKEQRKKTNEMAGISPACSGVDDILNQAEMMKSWANKSWANKLLRLG
jgi:hypothetical protein